MAVTTNPIETRLRLVFYVGDDQDGNPIQKAKSFANVKPTASKNEDMYTVATSVGQSPTYTLVQTEQI